MLRNDSYLTNQEEAKQACGSTSMAWLRPDVYIVTTAVGIKVAPSDLPRNVRLAQREAYHLDDPQVVRHLRR